MLRRETRALSHHTEPLFRPTWIWPSILRTLRDGRIHPLQLVLVWFFFHMGSSASEKPHGDMEWVDFVPARHTSFLQVITHKLGVSINFAASVVSCRKRRITYSFPVQTSIRFGQRQQIHFYQEQNPDWSITNTMLLSLVVDQQLLHTSFFYFHPCCNSQY